MLAAGLTGVGQGTSSGKTECSVSRREAKERSAGVSSSASEASTSRDSEGDAPRGGRGWGSAGSWVADAAAAGASVGGHKRRTTGGRAEVPWAVWGELR